MGLYNDNNDTNRKGLSNARLSKMTSKLSFSMSDILPEPEKDKGEMSRHGQGRFGGAGRRLSKSWIGEASSTKTETLLTQDVDDIEFDRVRGHVIGEKHILAAASSPKTVDVHIQQATQDSDNSDDDRSNNGQFEYYPVTKPTRKEALERRRSYRNKDDMRQSLPPKCERFIGIHDVAHVPLKVKTRDSAISKSMPPNNTEFVKLNAGEEHSYDALIGMLYSSRQHQPGKADAQDNKPAISLANNREVLEFNREMVEIKNKILEDLEQSIRSGSDASDSERNNRWSLEPSTLCQHIATSTSLPSKNNRDDSIQAACALVKNVSSKNSRFYRRKSSSQSTDDISQVTDGSELLVYWGEQ
jgi:hypothetical protein